MKLCEICNKYYDEIGFHNHMKNKHNIIPIFNKSKLNPNFIFNYFENIDSIEKSYWLGYLYADGYVNNSNMKLVLTTSEKDIEVLNHFADCVLVDKNKIKKRIHKTGHISYSLIIFSKQMCKNLIESGCLNKKSFIIRLPELKDEEFYSAFLLGYYDGDGISKTSTICSGSKIFLEDVRNHFNIFKEIKQKANNVFYLTLGIELLRKIMKVYENSLQRKRIKTDPLIDERFSKINRIYHINYNQKNRKFNIDKEELIKLLSQYSLEYIGSLYSVSGNSIKKRAIKLNIDENLIKKGRGYWTKMKFMEQ